MDGKSKAIKDISEAMKPDKENDGDIAAGSVQELIQAIYAEPDRKKRKKLIRDFTARHSDAADFIYQNEKLINAEAEAALIGAAVGGMTTETKISYKGGRKHETVTRKSLPPNAPLLALLLKNRMPDRYSDKPLAETEIEDITETEADIYGGENQKQEDHTV